MYGQVPSPALPKRGVWAYMFIAAAGSLLVLLHSALCWDVPMRRLLVLALSVGFVPAVHAQGKHPFTFEDMMALKRVEEPVPSPDGKWVLFAAVDVDLKANTKTPHVWMVPLNMDTHVSQRRGDMGHPMSDQLSDQSNSG